MPTKEELKQLFLKKGDEELLNIYFNKDGYTPEAIEAMNEILDERGGAEKWIKEKEQEFLKQKEIETIRGEAYSQLMAGKQVHITTQATIPNEEIQKIIAEEQVRVQAVIADEKVTVSIVGKALAGGALGAALGGILWGTYANLLRTYILHSRCCTLAIELWINKTIYE